LLLFGTFKTVYERWAKVKLLVRLPGSGQVEIRKARVLRGRERISQTSNRLTHVRHTTLAVILFNTRICCCDVNFHFNVPTELSRMYNSEKKKKNWRSRCGVAT